MGTAKAVSLSVRPYQVSHLCFELDGILEVSTALAELGATVPAFDFPAFYAILGASPTVAGDPSQLLFNFPEIDAAVAPFALCALRKEPRKVALAQAVNSRQNSYFAKFANAGAIIAQMNSSYSPSVVGSKTQRLEVLAALASDQWALLKAAYTSDGRTGVQRTTNSVLTSRTASGGTSNEQGGSQEQGGSSDTGGSNQESVGLLASGTIPAPPTPPGNFSWSASGPVNVDLDEQRTEESGTNWANTTNQENSTSSGWASQTQHIANVDYGYRTPYYEAAAQFERAQISLIDQQFQQFMTTQNFPHLDRVFANEFNNMDGNVFRLQVAYLNSILMSPIKGTVTGVYKHPGDPIRAGEPVIRVEDNSTILILAKVVYRGPVTVGSAFTVATQLFEASPLTPPMSGTVVAAKGTCDDDTWELIVKCDNLDASSNPIFPSGYHFDYDDTSITIS